MTNQQLLYLNRVIDQFNNTQLELEQLRKVSVTKNENEQISPVPFNYHMLLRLNMINDVSDRFHLIAANKKINISTIQFSRLAVLVVLRECFGIGATLPRDVLLSDDDKKKNKSINEEVKRRTDPPITNLNEKICEVCNIGDNPVYLPVEKVDRARMRLSIFYNIDIGFVLDTNNTIHDQQSVVIVRNILSNFIDKKNYSRKDGSKLTLKSLVWDKIEQEEWLKNCLLASELNDIFKDEISLLHVINENNHD